MDMLLKNLSFLPLHFPLVNISYIFMGENLNSTHLIKKTYQGDFFFFLMGVLPVIFPSWGVGGKCSTVGVERKRDYHF